MNSIREQYLNHVAHCLDDALSIRNKKEIPTGARLVVYYAGFEPLVVAVWSYLSSDGSGVSTEEAEEIATDYLLEIGWSDDGDLKAIEVI